MNRFINRTTLSAAALAVSLGTIMSANAEQVNETFVQAPGVRSEAVTYSHTELASDAGRAAVERRIEKAAEKVCGLESYSIHGSLSRYGKAKECYGQAVAQAMSEVNTNQVASIAR